MTLSALRWELNFSQCFDQGGRNYMEDFCYSHIERNDVDALFGIFGIFDGHGGPEAANFVHKTLKDELMKLDQFWSNDAIEVMESIKLVYSKLQKLLWIERENWIKTISGYKSTAGTTATIVIIRNGILYTGHVGDSGILLLYLNEDNNLQSEELTNEHKPDNPVEKKRIEESGGSLVRKAGVDRVVWNRKRLFQSSDEVDRIPFLAVARSLGDLWSYDMKTDRYHVSPEPDVQFINLNSDIHRAIIIASDGLWNVVSRDMAVKLITLCLHLNRNGKTYSPAQVLVSYSLHLWRKKNIKADNISAVVVLLQPECIDSRSVHILPLEGLQSELMTNNLLDSSFYHEPTVVLNNIDDFALYKSHYKLSLTVNGIGNEDMELLRAYLLTDSKFSMFCDPWHDSEHYWDIFTKAFGNLGCTSFPNIVSYLETCSKVHVEELMLVLPWSVCCLDVINLMRLTKPIKAFIQRQPLLTDFWTSLFRSVIGKRFQFIQSQRCNISKIGTMRNVLISKSSDINDWIISQSSETSSEFSITHSSSSSTLSASSSSTFSSVVSSDTRPKCALKKSSTCMDQFSCVAELFASGTGSAPLRRSASFDLSKSNLFGDLRANIIMPFVDSGSTKSFTASPTCDTTTAVDGADIANKLSANARQSLNVPFSLKRKISDSVAQLIFLPRKEPTDHSKSDVIKKFALTKKTRLLL